MPGLFRIFDIQNTWVNAEKERASADYRCRCEERSDVAISCWIVQIPTLYQEIATGCALAMTRLSKRGPS